MKEVKYTLEKIFRSKCQGCMKIFYSCDLPAYNFY
jgi:hypothetical protein